MHRGLENKIQFITTLDCVNLTASLRMVETIKKKTQFLLKLNAWDYKTRNRFIVPSHMIGLY